MKRSRKVAVVVIAAAMVLAFFLAPVVYSPTNLYLGVSAVVGSGCVQEGTPTCSQPTATYPNWDSLSCWAFGLGMHYGLTVYQPGDSYQFGCYPPPFWSVL